jgi:SAM-dependent methyltransferase
MTSATFRSLARVAADRYRDAGRFAVGFARGKLTADPVFEQILEKGWLRNSRQVLDLGCGQGLLAALLLSARQASASGRWPAHWAPAPPSELRIRGVELMARDVERAHRALGDDASIEQGDITTADFARADTVVILDVLHYLSYDKQDDVLARVRRCLGDGGRLVLRVGDAQGGLAFRISQWVDRTVTFCRGHRLGRLYCRTVPDWTCALRSLGFTVALHPMSQGTPFANVLIIADC